MIRFAIRDLENKLRIFNRNYNVVIEITILPLFQKLEFLGSYTGPYSLDRRDGFLVNFNLKSLISLFFPRYEFSFLIKWFLPL